VSDELHFTRLRWSQGRGGGIAKLHGRSVPLTALPELRCCPDMVEVDYVPEISLGRIREATEGWRDMGAQERREADALLRRLVP
jgi:hypothetical protein